MAANIAIAMLLTCLLSSPAAAQPIDPAPNRRELYQALLAAGVFHPDRLLVHLSHSCNLRVDGQYFPIIDMQELVKGAATPRGVNHILVLDAKLKVAQTIEYTSERPLFCQDNRLFVFGDLSIGGLLPEGNVLTFTNRAKTISLSHLEANDLPVPATRQRKQAPQ
jgi:hypothetical protein